MYMCLTDMRFSISTAAFDYLKSHPVGPVDEEEFNQYCGVGVVVTAEQIQHQVRATPTTAAILSTCISCHIHVHVLSYAVYAG